MDVRAVPLRNVCRVLLLLLLLQSARAHGGGHGHLPVSPEDRPTGFHDPKVVQDADHIKEHYEGLANFNEAEMSSTELAFHYFKLHDFDNNTKLDGLEIYQALTHLVSGDQSEADVAAIVDTVLHEDDTNRDGYVTYTEYVLANRREDARARFEEQKNRESQREP